MAKPDDDHVPTAITDDSGEVIAVAHMAPDASDEAKAALAEVVAAAIRMHEARPDRAEMDARQAASREMIRERNARLQTDLRPVEHVARWSRWWGHDRSRDRIKP